MAVLEMLGNATRLGWEREREEGREDDGREGGSQNGGKGRRKRGRKKWGKKKQRKQNTHNSHLSFRGQHVSGGIV